ncbi:MAG: methyltransferase domain-containing protein [Actinomycetota bacterium]|nr:methyltransferase domain-containing protein [Actinomycetota bacterium]MDD5667764.1 methyltransferase domain-containing protein [Actinomycetota bacterium]
MGEYGGLAWEALATLVPREDAYAWSLYESDPFRRSSIIAAIEELGLTPGSRGLDAGCGIGLQAMLLADAVGPGGHVTGLDISQTFLDCAAAITREAGYAERIVFTRGDISALPFEDGAFDWVWSADCAGYQACETLPLVGEVARVVKPGGIVAFLVYSSQQLLTGYPLLEARLNATTSGIAPFAADMAPEEHYLRALGWFHAAGLEDELARTFVAGFQAPLEAKMRTALLALVKMRWPDVRHQLEPDDWELFQRLCDPASPDFILDAPGYYAFVTETLFYARVPA